MTVYFLIPGDITALTGGYGYDRRVIAELRALGEIVEVVGLPAGFPYPTPTDIADSERIFASLPDGATVLIDGLAGALLGNAIAAEARRLHIVMLCHHPLALESGIDVATARRFEAAEKAALAACKAVIVTSPATAQTLITSFEIAAGLITVAVPGTDKFPPAPGNGNPPVLLTIASLIRRKAHDVLIEALDKIRDLSWISRIVGGERFDPVWAESLKLRVEALGLTDRILFDGDIADPVDLYQSSDIFVLPSRYEGFGMVFAEAMAHGLPVVAARGGAVPDVVPETAGILVPVDDVNALAEALRRLLQDADLRADLRQGAVKAGQKLQDWTTTAGLIRDCLDRARE